MNTRWAAVISCICIFSGVNCSSWEGFEEKFPTSPGDGYYPIDPNKIDITKFIIGTGIGDTTYSNTNYQLWCSTLTDFHPCDPRMCVMYDNKESMVGFEVGILKSAVPQEAEAYYDKEIFLQTKRCGKDVYVVQVFRIRPGKGDEDSGSGIWIKNGDEYINIPNDQNEVANSPDFKYQRCVDGLGDHYYYQFSKNLKCEEYLPVLGLYDDGELVGYGFEAFGQPETYNGTQQKPNWDEGFPVDAVKAFFLGDAPDCLIDYFQNYGILSRHYWFITGAKNITCPTSFPTSEKVEL